MLRYLEDPGLVAPARTPAGYRLYGLRELNQLRSLRELRRRFGVDRRAAFAPRLRRDPDSASPSTRGSPRASGRQAQLHVAWVDWGQSKHERLLAA